MWIVRIALRRPYTFVVLALLILMVGPLTIARTPTDIFPNINIPVVTIVWNYGGLSADEMATRIVSIYERNLTTTVNDIEHVESQSLRGIAVVKVFFQPGANIDLAVAQVTASAQSQLRQLPPGTQPPFILTYNASTVPVLQLALSGKGLSEQQLFDIAVNFLRTQLASVNGAQIPYPYGGKQPQIQVDLVTRGDAGQTPHASRRRQRHQRAEPHPARRNAEARVNRIRCGSERQPEDDRGAERPADPDRRRQHDLHPRRRARPQRLPAADQHRPRRWIAGGAADDSEGRQRLDARHHQQRQGGAAADRGAACRRSSKSSRWPISPSSSRPRSRAFCARR